MEKIMNKQIKIKLSSIKMYANVNNCNALDSYFNSIEQINYDSKFIDYKLHEFYLDMQENSQSFLILESCYLKNCESKIQEHFDSIGLEYILEFQHFLHNKKD